MTYDEFIAIFGSTLPAHVTLQGGDTYDITLNAFSYSYAPNGWDVSQNPVCNSSQSASAFRYAYYAGSIFPNGGGKTPVESMTIDFQATFDNAHWGFFVSDSSSFAVSSSWLLANSSCTAGQFGFIAANSDSSKIAKANWGLLERDMKFCPFYADGSSVSIDGITVTNFQSEGQSTICIGFMCPLYDDNFQAGIPTTTTATATTAQNPNINVTVDVDLSETNTFLGDIKAAILGLPSTIATGIQNIFTPSQNYIENWKISLVTLLHDTFVPYDFAWDNLNDLCEDILSQGAIESIQFPAIKAGSTTILAAQSVPLRPTGYSDFFDAVATAIDIVATCLFINMVLNKFQSIVVGEKVVDIQDDD